MFTWVLLLVCHGRHGRQWTVLWSAPPPNTLLTWVFTASLLSSSVTLSMSSLMNPTYNRRRRHSIKFILITEHSLNIEGKCKNLQTKTLVYFYELTRAKWWPRWSHWSYSCMKGPVLLYNAPDNSCSRQNGEEKVAAPLMLSPIQVCVFFMMERVESGRGGENVTERMGQKKKIEFTIIAWVNG